MRPRLLDLYCGEGGAGHGYHQAGFDVTGIDITPRPRYPHSFILGDALTYLAAHGEEYDAIHASPPCQSETALRHVAGRAHHDWLTPTLDALRATWNHKPWVVENVPTPKLAGALMLCGAAFGLGIDCPDGRYRPLKRHRLFASNVFLMGPGCACTGQQPVGVYGDGGGGQFLRGWRLSAVGDMRTLMGIPWASRAGLSQAIPPAYTRHIGEQLITHLEGEASCPGSRSMTHFRPTPSAPG